MTKSDMLAEEVKWMKSKCKEQQKKVTTAENIFGETKLLCLSKSEQNLVEKRKLEFEREKAKLEAFVEIKVSLERFMKRCRHEECKKLDDGK